MFCADSSAGVLLAAVGLHWHMWFLVNRLQQRCQFNDLAQKSFVELD